MLSTPSAARALAAAIMLGLAGSPAAAAEPTVKDVLTTYADIAQAAYEDALGTAKTLKLAVDALL
ncbi:MAG: imelysin family protein, partial [Methyloceanibacter sp.]